MTYRYFITLANHLKLYLFDSSAALVNQKI